MSKTKVIAFANNKGGSGKTTSCSNIGCALALMGKKVGERVLIKVNDNYSYYVVIRAVTKGEDDESLTISSF